MEVTMITLRKFFLKRILKYNLGSEVIERSHEEIVAIPKLDQLYRQCTWG